MFKESNSKAILTATRTRPSGPDLLEPPFNELVDQAETL